jgi:hypothetical protein
MDFHWWQIGPLTVLLGRIVGRKKAGTRHDSVKNREREQPSLPTTTLDHFVAAPARILGSAQYTSTSAKKFPATRKTVEQSTPPITT